MFIRSFLALAAFAVLSAATAAQSPSTPSGPNDTARISTLEAGLMNYLESDDDGPRPLTRPRIVEIKDSGVKASVVVNTMALERAAFTLLNSKRADLGLAPLAWSDQIAAIARLHSQNMAEFNFFSHRGLDDKMVSDRADDMHLGRWRSIGENIAYNRGYKDPVTKAVDQWMNSPAHRQNLMDKNWREAAVGIAVAADGSYYFTQVFLRK